MTLDSTSAICCFRCCFVSSVYALWSVSMRTRLLDSWWMTNLRGVYCTGVDTWLKTAPSFSSAKILKGGKVRKWDFETRSTSTFQSFANIKCYFNSCLICTILFKSFIIKCYWALCHVMHPKHAHKHAHEASTTPMLAPEKGAVWSSTNKGLVHVSVTYLPTILNTVFDLISVLFAYGILGQKNRPNLRTPPPFFILFILFYHLYTLSASIPVSRFERVCGLRV